MSYQVIARKWRPQTFEEVTGQEPVTRTLLNAIEHERLHHAYLFSGARGVGKTTTARLLAKAVNCHKAKGPTASPCRVDDADACASCREVAEGRSIDVLEIDAASNTQVEKTREVIINNIGIAPARDRYKVFIIDEVHMLSTSSFNALLKTLEEPPPRVLFIMATTEQHKLPDTILSRCQQFEFRTIAAAKIAERLRLIADAEAIKVTDEALAEIARAGEGSMRDAQSAFDQVISFSDGEIKPADVEAALGLAGAEILARVVRAVAEEKPAEMFAVVDELVMRGHDLRNFCRDLLAHLRDLLISKVTGESPATVDSSGRASAEAVRDFSESDLVRFFHSLSETERQLRESVHPRYQLEIGLVKLIEMRRLAPLSKIIERLNALEDALRGGKLPADGGSGAQTPPAGDAGTSSRRGGAASGRGAAFADPDQTSRLASEDHAETSSARNGTSHATTSDASPQAETGNTHNQSHEAEMAAQSDDADDGARQANAAARVEETTREMNDAPSAGFGAGRAAVSAYAKLKLVPPLSTASATAVAASSATIDVAPFALGDEAPQAFDFATPQDGFAAVKAGEDRVGEPVGLVEAESLSDAKIDALAETGVEVEVEPTDTASLIRRALESRNKPLLAMAFDGASRVRVEGEEVCVEFAPDAKHLREMLNKPEAMRLLREVCCEVLNRPVGFRTELRTPGASDEDVLTPEDEERLERRRLRERAEGHHALRQVLKTFRAEIIEVRRAEEHQAAPAGL